MLSNAWDRLQARSLSQIQYFSYKPPLSQTLEESFLTKFIGPYYQQLSVAHCQVHVFILCGDMSFSSAAPRIWNCLSLILDLVFVPQHSNLFTKLILCHRFSRTNCCVCFSLFCFVFGFYCALNTQQGRYVHITHVTSLNCY